LTGGAGGLVASIKKKEYMKERFTEENGRERIVVQRKPETGETALRRCIKTEGAVGGEKGKTEKSINSGRTVNSRI